MHGLRVELFGELDDFIGCHRSRPQCEVGVGNEIFECIFMTGHAASVAVEIGCSIRQDQDAGRLCRFEKIEIFWGSMAECITWRAGVLIGQAIGVGHSAKRRQFVVLEDWSGIRRTVRFAARIPLQFFETERRLGFQAEPT
jgi:hypothetical protein